MEENGVVSRFGTRIHITALDGIIHVNSLFTIATFIGLAWQPTDPNADFVDDPSCAATVRIAEDLVVFHVYSFSCFLFSSIIALGLKQVIRMVKSVSDNNNHRRIFTIEVAHINRTALRMGYLVSAIGSVSGCICLMLALMNMVQIKLGTLGCGTLHNYGAVVPLLILFLFLVSWGNDGIHESVKDLASTSKTH